MAGSGSLFSGVAGLDRAAAEVFGVEPAWFCDNDPAAAKVLAYRWPGVPNLGDITTVDWDQVEPVWLLTGGFPCTDVSSAGKRAGMHSGTRSGLWAHMAYAISRLRPQIVVIENVRGLLTARGAEPTAELVSAWAEQDKARRVLDLIDSKLRRARRSGKQEHVHRHVRDRIRFVGRLRSAVAAAKRADSLIVRAIGAVLGTLADLGYDSVWCGLPASAVGACHERFRIFILAVARGVATNPSRDGRHEGGPEPARFVGGSDAALGGGEAPADTTGARRPRHLAGAAFGGEPAYGSHEPTRATGGPDRDAANTESGRSARDDGSARSGSACGGGERIAVGDAGAVAWGIYTAAIRRWERVIGRAAPVPRITGPRGGLKLNPALPEWMQGFPAGWITDVPGVSVNDALRLAGNSVNPIQAVAALRWCAAQLNERAA